MFPEPDGRGVLGRPVLFVGRGFRVCVRTAKPVLQRLKPHRFRCVYVVAEATTYKDSTFLTQTLQPLKHGSNRCEDFVPAAPETGTAISERRATDGALKCAATTAKSQARA